MGPLDPLERVSNPFQPPLVLLRNQRRDLTTTIRNQIRWKSRGDWGAPASSRQPHAGYLEVDGLAGALEVDLDEEQPLVVLAADGLEEAAAADDVEEHEVVGGRQVVEVVLRRRRLRRPRDLIPHRGLRLRRRRCTPGSPATPGACFASLLASRGSSWRCVGRRRSNRVSQSGHVWSGLVFWARTR